MCLLAAEHKSFRVVCSLLFFLARVAVSTQAVRARVAVIIVREEPNTRVMASRAVGIVLPLIGTERYDVSDVFVTVLK